MVSVLLSLFILSSPSVVLLSAASSKSARSLSREAIPRLEDIEVFGLWGRLSVEQLIAVLKKLLQSEDIDKDQCQSTAGRSYCVFHIKSGVSFEWILQVIKETA